MRKIELSVEECLMVYLAVTKGPEGKGWNAVGLRKVENILDTLESNGSESEDGSTILFNPTILEIKESEYNQLKSLVSQYKVNGNKGNRKFYLGLVDKIDEAENIKDDMEDKKDGN